MEEPQWASGFSGTAFLKFFTVATQQFSSPENSQVGSFCVVWTFCGKPRAAAGQNGGAVAAVERF
jgi:hypothetical protein